MKVGEYDRSKLAGEMGELDREKREEIVWVQDVNSMVSDNELGKKVEQGLMPTTSMAIIKRDKKGMLTNIILEHQGSGRSYYGKQEDYLNGRIKIEGNTITGGMQGPLRIVKRDVTPEQKLTARYGARAEFEEGMDFHGTNPNYKKTE